jgi:hypothetical protein
MIEENLYFSQKIGQTLSLHHDIVKKLITGDLDLRWVNLKWILQTLTTSQKLERVKISRKLFKQLNKLQINDLTRLIKGMKAGAILKIRDQQCGCVLTEETRLGSSGLSVLLRPSLNEEMQTIKSFKRIFQQDQ